MRNIIYDHTVANIYRKGLRAGKHSVNDITATYLTEKHLTSRSLRKACCLASIQSSPQYFCLSTSAQSFSSARNKPAFADGPKKFTTRQKCLVI